MKKKMSILVGVLILCLLMVSCNKSVPVYEKFDDIPDFGQFVESAEIVPGGDDITELFAGRLEEAYVYNIPEEDRPKAIEYYELLKEQGFVPKEEIEDTETDIVVTMTNQESERSIMYGVTQHTEKPDTLVILLWIMRN